jgi:hypothetical protein
MLLAVVYDRLSHARNGPFARFAAAACERQAVRLVYNDIDSSVSGFQESCLALIERNSKTRRVNVCFARNHKSPTGGLACPIGSVLGILATGVYQQILKAEGVAPHQVSFFEYSPRVTDPHPSFMDRGPEFPPLWRKVEVAYENDAFEVVSRPGVRQMQIDPAWKRNVPKALIEFHNCSLPAGSVDLQALTPYRADQRNYEEIVGHSRPTAS